MRNLHNQDHAVTEKVMSEACNLTNNKANAADMIKK